jgi:hypothetical protein
MMSKRSNQEPAAARSPRETQIERGVIVVGVCVVQALVAFYTFVAGLGWTGVTYTVAVSQSVLAFGVIAALAAIVRRPSLLFLVPLVSLALSVALGLLGEDMGDTGY